MGKAKGGGIIACDDNHKNINKVRIWGGRCCLILLIVFVAETIKCIQILEELFVIIIGVKEVIKSDNAIGVLVDDLHELTSLLLDVHLLIRGQLDLLLAGLLATLLQDWSLKHLTEGLLGELASALAVGESEGRGELGLLVGDTDAHEQQELSKVHLARLVAAAQTPDVLVHVALLLVSFALLVEESIPVHLVNDLPGVVLAHLLKSKLDLMIGLGVNYLNHKQP